VISQNYGTDCRTIDYYVNSHLHLDHIGYIQANYDANQVLLNDQGNPWTDGDSLQNPRFIGGIAHLVNERHFEVRQSFFRDYIAHNPNRLPNNNGSKTYWNWRAYLHQHLE
jgi:L-ascorbate metabolism protein UlaG (beta-lactamase superfamily)